MKRLAKDISTALGAIVGFVGAWVIMTGFVEASGVPFGVPGVVICSTVGLVQGARFGNKVATRYGLC